MMNKLHVFLSHAVVVLSLMFLVFLVLDLFNPLMNFVDHPISRVLLALMCVSGISLALSERTGPA